MTTERSIVAPLELVDKNGNKVGLGADWTVCFEPRNSSLRFLSPDGEAALFYDGRGSLTSWLVLGGANLHKEPLRCALTQLFAIAAGCPIRRRATDGLRFRLGTTPGPRSYMRLALRARINASTSRQIALQSGWHIAIDTATKSVYFMNETGSQATLWIDRLTKGDEPAIKLRDLEFRANTEAFIAQLIALAAGLEVVDVHSLVTGNGIIRVFSFRLGTEDELRANGHALPVAIARLRQHAAEQRSVSATP